MSRFGVKEVADVIFYDAITGEPKLFLDSLKMSNLTSENESSDLTGGRGNARIMTFDYDRRATFTLQDALMRPEAFSMQAGTELKEGKTEVHNRELLVVTNGAVELSEVPSGDVMLYNSPDGYAHNDKTKIGADEITDKNIDMLETGNDSTFVDDTQVVAYYKYETGEDAQSMVVRSDSFGGYYKVVGKTIVRNAETNVDEAFEIEIPRAKIGSNFEIELAPDGDPAVFDMELMVYEPSDRNDNMITMTRY